MNQEEIERKVWGFVYCYTISNKKYVGWTMNLKERFKKHLREKKVNPHFHNSLRKYFKLGDFHIIEAFHETNKNLKLILKEREIFWINELNTYNPKQEKGWNLTKGGDGGDTFTNNPKKEEIRKTFIEYHNNPKNKENSSIKQKKYIKEHPEVIKNWENKMETWRKKQPKTEKINSRKIKKYCEEHKEEIHQRNKKRWESLKEREKQSKRTKENFKKHPELGRNHSKKISGEKNPRARAVILISPEGKKYILPCSQPFCNEWHLNSSHIHEVLKGKRRHHKGWTGKYLEDINDR